MNAIEHGNENRRRQPGDDPRRAPTATTVLVRITDRGEPVELRPETPDLEAKLEGRRSRAAGACS